MQNNTDVRTKRAKRLKSVIERIGARAFIITENTSDSAHTCMIRRSDVSAWLKGGYLDKKTGSYKNYLTSDNIEKILQVLEYRRVNIPSLSNLPIIQKEYLLGDSEYMTREEEFNSIILKSRSLNDSLQVLLDWSLNEICIQENISKPDNFGDPLELLFLQAQIKDYALSLMRNYIHSDNSNVWKYLEYIETITKESGSSTDNP